MSVCHAPLPANLPPVLDEICLDATELALKAEILVTGVFWANLMHLILSISKFDILRVPPIQIPTKKGKILKFG
jgi:hypothetical protein